MRKTLAILLTATVSITSAQSQPPPDGFVLVEGGAFTHTKSRAHRTNVTVADFYIGTHEVTQKEWMEVMGNNPSQFKGDDRPVEMVSWYDCIEYCNQRSLKEGLQPCYTIDKLTRDPHNQNDVDELKWTVTVNDAANGYRLPTEIEWEYAASGGQQSRSLRYCGSDDLDQVGWFWQNSGEKPLSGFWTWAAIEQNKSSTQPVGRKTPNELGLYDMSGNAREWCWDWFEDLAGSGVPSGLVRVWKGGGWMGGDFCCEPSFRSSFEPYSRGNDQGFRLCRTK